MDSRPSRILLVEDNPTTARTLRLFLEALGYEVVRETLVNVVAPLAESAGAGTRRG